MALDLYEDSGWKDHESMIFAAYHPRQIEYYK